MEAQFVVQLDVGGIAMEQRTETAAKTVDESHRHLDLHGAKDAVDSGREAIPGGFFGLEASTTHFGERVKPGAAVVV